MCSKHTYINLTQEALDEMAYFDLSAKPNLKKEALISTLEVVNSIEYINCYPSKLFRHFDLAKQFLLFGIAHPRNLQFAHLKGRHHLESALSLLLND